MPPPDSALQRFIKHFDWILFISVILLCSLGLVMVFSASLRFGHPETYFLKQLSAFMIGLASLFLLTTINYQIFSQYPRTLFSFSLFLLLIVLVLGTTSHGHRSWIVFGPFSLQTSEISRLFCLLVLAGWCDKNKVRMKNISNLAIPFLVVGSHVALILLEPDFSSTLVYFPILLGVLYASGARIFHLVAMLFYGAVSAVIILTHTLLFSAPGVLEAHPAWNFLFKAMTPGKECLLVLISIGLIFLLLWWFAKQLRTRIPAVIFASAYLLIASGWLSGSVFVRTIQDYQRQRLAVFLKPGLDPLGSGYHVIQSVVALGSGRIFGKGLFSSTQGRLGFLPEQHTDFIFSVMGEELGFVVSGFVLLLYFILVWRAFSIAGDSRDSFGSYIAVGVGAMFFFYVAQNLAMVMGMTPVTGLALPFLSYGGSSMISSLSAVGLLLSIHVRRYAY